MNNRVLVVINTELQLLYAYGLIKQKNINPSNCYFISSAFNEDRLESIAKLASILNIDLLTLPTFQNIDQEHPFVLDLYKKLTKEEYAIIISSMISAKYKLPSRSQIIVSNAFKGNRLCEIYEVPDGSASLKEEVNIFANDSDMISWYSKIKKYGYSTEYFKSITTIPFVKQNNIQSESLVNLSFIKNLLPNNLSNRHPEENALLVIGGPYSELSILSLAEEVVCTINLKHTFNKPTFYFPHAGESKKKLELLESCGISIIKRDEHAMVEIYYLCNRMKYSAVISYASSCLFNISSLDNEAKLFYYRFKNNSPDIQVIHNAYIKYIQNIKLANIKNIFETNYIQKLLDKDDEIQKQKIQINEQNTHIQEQRNQIEYVTQELKDCKTELNRIYNSKGWKLMRPFRLLMRIARSAIRKIRSKK